MFYLFFDLLFFSHSQIQVSFLSVKKCCVNKFFYFYFLQCQSIILFPQKCLLQTKNLFLKMSVNVDSAITTSDRRRDRQDDQIQQTTNQGSAVGGNNNNYHNNNSNETGAAATFVLPGSTNQSTAELVAFVLLGKTVTVDGVEISLPLQHENFPPNFTSTILAGGREILLQRQFGTKELNRIDEGNEHQQLPQFDDQECAIAVAQKLVQLHATLGVGFVGAQSQHFSLFIRCGFRNNTTVRLSTALVGCFVPSDEDAAVPDLSVLAASQADPRQETIRR